MVADEEGVPSGYEAVGVKEDGFLVTSSVFFQTNALLALWKRTIEMTRVQRNRPIYTLRSLVSASGICGWPGLG